MNGKNFYRIRESKKICGVCAGVAEYFNIDVSLVRILWGVLSFAYGIAIILYFVCAFVLPYRDEIQ